MAAGPILLFDKSALQSLTVDESVWLDQFFLTNITPIFYVETLADLEKADPKGRSAEDVVGNMADKTPVFHPYPNVFHRTLLIQDLLGRAVPMTGQIVLDGGIPKRDPDGGSSVLFNEPAEVEIMRRWQAREFMDAERLHARNWRAGLSGIDFESKIAWAQRLVPAGRKITSLADAKVFADEFVIGAGREVVTFAGQVLEIPDEHWPAIERRFAAMGRPPLKDFAPYAAFVLTVDLVFYLGMGSHQIGAERPSSMIDVAYLYYLPFGMVFVSGDRLHARLVPLFLRQDQRFVNAADLKAGLKQLNDHYALHRAEIDRIGIISFAPEPPAEVHTIVTTLWDELLHRGDRRDAAPKREAAPEQVASKPPSNDELLRRITHIAVSVERIPESEWHGQPESVVMRHQIPVQRGSWRLVAEGAEKRDG